MILSECWIVLSRCATISMVPIFFILSKESWIRSSVSVSILAVALQGTADVQMHRFRKNRTGNFIRNGLWKYSRHPNYLGEIMMWWGIALATVCVMPTRWWLIFGAVANTLLFMCISIPLAEKRQSKKEGYAEYKKQTRVLFPIKKSLKK